MGINEKYDNYGIYLISLTDLLEIPTQLEKKLKEIEYDAKVAIEETSKNRKAIAELTSLRKIEIERELLVLKDKLVANGIAQEYNVVLNQSESLPKYKDAFTSLQIAGMAVDRAIREERKRCEEAAKLMEQKTSKQGCLFAFVMILSWSLAVVKLVTLYS